MIKRLFYILLPIIIIDLIFDGEELIKFPYLINHFVQHLYTDKIDFWQFIRLHYSENQHSSSSQEHGNLPFKDHHNCAHIHVYLNKVYFLQLKKLYPVISFVFSDSVDNILSPCYFSVWHPPRA